MYCKLTSSALKGVDGLIVSVEIDISNGLPSFDLVGLPDSSVRESKERVRSAIRNSGYPFPVKRITINLAPADYKKEGSYYDLPIALGILCCMGVIKEESLNSCMIAGELSLNGDIKPVKGILPIAITAKKAGLKQCIVPLDNAMESSLVKGIDTVGVSSLKETISYLNKQTPGIVKPFEPNIYADYTYDDLNFSDVKGQESVKRALEIAATGKHNLIMIGPPGSGKTMMANRIPSILPKLSYKESIEVTKIYSICNKSSSNSCIITEPPFRSPHHTTTSSALIGGGRTPTPGEISLAHNGVLFLDEFLEFNKTALETLRQPLESKSVTISRVNASLKFPADFMLIASTNPCPCGFYPNIKKCECSDHSIKNYLKKLSGPLMDRIDMHIETKTLKYDNLRANDGEDSKEIRKRVVMATEIQKERYKKVNILYNSQLTPSLIDKFCYLGSKENDLLKNAFNTLKLNARSYHKIITLARTIADLESSENININHLSEAIQYRVLDRQITN